MKTLANLPESTELSIFKVKLPDSVYEASSLPGYNIKNQPVYLIGHLMGDFFVKINIDDTQVYPLFRSHITWEEMSQWEVVE